MLAAVTSQENVQTPAVIKKLTDANRILILEVERLRKTGI